MTSRQQILRRRPQPMQVVALIAVAYSGILLGPSRVTEGGRHHEFSNAPNTLLAASTRQKCRTFSRRALISVRLMGRPLARSCNCHLRSSRERLQFPDLLCSASRSGMITLPRTGPITLVRPRDRLRWLRSQRRPVSFRPRRVSGTSRSRTGGRRAGLSTERPTALP